MSNQSISPNLFGYFKYNFIKYEDLISLQENIENAQKTIPLRPLDLCVFSPERLLISDYVTRGLAIVDENFEIVKQIDNVNGDAFCPFALANSKDTIYATDGENMKIHVFDFERKIVGSVSTIDDASGHPYKPYGICYTNEILYVCDLCNNTIQTYTNQLKFIKSFKLDCQPWHIKVIDDIACVRIFNGNFISFYTLPSFTLKYRYYGHSGFIFTVNSCFLEFCQPDKIYHCYNKDGLLAFKKDASIDEQFMFDKFDPVVYFNNKLVHTQNRFNKLIT